jgi:molybdopterin molybdotransferase
MGFETIHLPNITRKITIPFENTSGKTLFLKAFFDDKKVTVLESQSSAMLNTFATANGLICLPFDQVNIEKDQEVLVIPIN